MAGAPRATDKVPDAQEQRLQAIIKGKVPLYALLLDDKKLIWERRASLTQHARALIPLFHSTRWEMEADVKEVLKVRCLFVFVRYICMYICVCVCM
jgi:hypothetical protein